MNKSVELQTEIDRLSEKLDAVGRRWASNERRTERGKLGFDWSGNVDEHLYRYCKDIPTSQAAKKVGARAERFQYEYQVLSHFNIDWAERNVRETAAMFRKYGQPEDIALLPDIGEPL
jgi:hypothetical protein